MFEVQLQPKQQLLYELVKGDKYSYIGFGGSRGGAKSHGIRDVSLTLSGEFAGIQILIIRRISKELTVNHINPYFQKYPKLREYYNKTDRMIYYPNGSITQFGSADNEDDIYTYQGGQYDLIFVDEATHFTQEMIQFLKSSNRNTIAGFRQKMILTMNPGGIGHPYIKRIMIDRKYEYNENPDDYTYIPARVYDNVVWVKDALKKKGFTAKDYYVKWSDTERKNFCYKYSQYVKDLQGLPEDMVKAYLEGDWEVFGGQFFKTFDMQTQMIEPFVIPKEWVLSLSIDPGFSSPLSAGLTARDFAGNYYRIATYYYAERDPETHAEEVKKWYTDPNSPVYKLIQGKRPDIMVSGRDAFAKKDRYSILASELTFADVWCSKGIYLQPAVTDRVLGWWTWKSLMPDHYFVFKDFNKPLIEEMTAVLNDGKVVEDIAGRGNDPNVPDHALDEQRYGLMSLYQPSQKLDPVLESLRGFGWVGSEVDYASFD